MPYIKEWRGEHVDDIHNIQEPDITSQGSISSILPASSPALIDLIQWEHLWALLFENMPTFPAMINKNSKLKMIWISQVE